MVEALTDQLFRFAPDAMIVFDDDGVILDANEQAGALFGVPVDEMTARNIAAFASGWDAVTEIQRLLAEGTARGEFEIVQGSGAVDVEYSSRARIAPGRHLTILRDESEKKRRERSLRETEELFARSFLGAPAGLSVADEHGRFLVVNEQFLEVTGYWRSEVIGRTAEELKLWAVPEQWATAHLALQSANFVPCFRLMFRTKSEGTREMLVCLSLIVIAGQKYVVSAAFKPD